MDGSEFRYLLVKSVSLTACMRTNTSYYPSMVQRPLTTESVEVFLPGSVGDHNRIDYQSREEEGKGRETWEGLL